jgi:hypothetical protein
VHRIVLSASVSAAALIVRTIARSTLIILRDSRFPSWSLERPIAEFLNLAVPAHSVLITLPVSFSVLVVYNTVSKLLAISGRVKQINVGTELRKAFGQSLRQTLLDDPTEFDRLKILAATVPALRDAVMRGVGCAGHRSGIM